ncbi:unnamed protein product [Closterium sp. Yama58-4]|nr:unnamed protein product [Closterium sp. Yama58-4]
MGSHGCRGKTAGLAGIGGGCSGGAGSIRVRLGLSSAGTSDRRGGKLRRRGGGQGKSAQMAAARNPDSANCLSKATGPPMLNISRRVTALQAEGRRVSALQAEGRRVSALQAEGRRVSALQAEGRRVSALQAEGRRVSALQAEGRRVSSQSSLPFVSPYSALQAEERGASALQAYCAAVERDAGSAAVPAPATGSTLLNAAPLVACGACERSDAQSFGGFRRHLIPVRGTSQPPDS